MNISEYTVISFLALLTVVSAAGVVVARKPFNSALWLIFTLCLIALHYVFMGAVLIALLQVLIYVGAIMVLIVFILMLLGNSCTEQEAKVSWIGASAAMFGGGLLGILAFMVVVWSAVIPVNISFDRGGIQNHIQNEVNHQSEVINFGSKLFGEYMYVCNLIGVLLFIALIGCVVLALEPKRKLAIGRGLKAMHDRGFADKEGK